MRIPRKRKGGRSGIRDVDAPIRCPGHLQWIRLHECLVGPVLCNGKIEAAHIRSGTDGGLALKPSDCYTVPLCSHHHAEQHRVGEQSFWKNHGMKGPPIEVALEMWRVSPHGIKHRAEMERGT